MADEDESVEGFLAAGAGEGSGAGETEHLDSTSGSEHCSL